MLVRFKSILIVVTMVLSIFFFNINSELMATNTNPLQTVLTSQDQKPLLKGNLNWGPIEVISEPIFGQDNNVGGCLRGKLAVENDKIYVVWADSSNLYGSGDDHDIFYRYFDGNTWAETQVISEPIPGNDINSMASWDPNIAVENGKIYVVWTDWSNLNGAETDLDIFYRCNITGSEWEDIQVISEPVFGKNYNYEWSDDPEIAVENGKIYVVWHDYNNTNGAGDDFDIFFKCNLTGNNWEDVQVISEPLQGSDSNKGYSYCPSIAVESSNIYVVWQDDTNVSEAGDDEDIFYICNITGNSWEECQIISDPILNNYVNYSSSPAIAVENNKIYVVWNDFNNTNGAGDTDMDIFFITNLTGSKWEDIQVVSEPVSGKDYNTEFSYHPRIKIENGNIHLTWYDQNNSNNAGNDIEVFYRCNLTGSNWENIEVISEPIFGKNINIERSWMPDIALEQGKIYIMWGDKNNTNSAGLDEDIFIRSTTTNSMTLRNPHVTPGSGDTNTEFIFTITYFHLKNMAPTEIKININDINYSMIAANFTDKTYYDGKSYYFNMANINIGTSSFTFWASDGTNLIKTITFNKPIIHNTEPKIITNNNLTAIEDSYYEIQYEYIDIDIANVGQIGTWCYSTNASWINFNPTTAIIYGTPLDDDVGSYWVNISITDTLDLDFTNFTLLVINTNDHPIINTTNIEITYEDELYEVDYNASDVDSPILNQIWSLETNATSWLNIDSATGIISGIPTNDDIGPYWINITVEDDTKGFDFTNFTLIVVNVNDAPTLITDNIEITDEDVYYENSYEATDIDTPLKDLIWNLNTNASWLKFDTIKAILNGTPRNDGVGTYWVNVSVSDGEHIDFTNFSLYVIGINDGPEIITDIFDIAKEDEYYEINLEAIDEDNDVSVLIWDITTTAVWLTIDPISLKINGTPSNDDVGYCWINVSLSDKEITVTFDALITILNINDPPKIITEDVTTASTGKIYSVYYEAIDIDPTDDTLIWSLKTNAGDWLRIEPNSGWLSGQPSENDVGEYWVNVTVNDGEGGEDFHNFILTVKSSKEETQYGEIYLLIIILIIVIIIIALVNAFRKRRKELKEPVVKESSLPLLAGPPKEPQSKELFHAHPPIATLLTPQVTWTEEEKEE